MRFVSGDFISPERLFSLSAIINAASRADFTRSVENDVGGVSSLAGWTKVEPGLLPGSWHGDLGVVVGAANIAASAASVV